MSVEVRWCGLLIGSFALSLVCGCTGLNVPLGQADDFEVPLEPPVTAITRDLVLEQQETRADEKVPADIDAHSFARSTDAYRYEIGAGDVLQISIPALTTFSRLLGTPTAGQESSSGSGIGYASLGGGTESLTNSGGLTETHVAAGGYVVSEGGEIYLPYVGFVKVSGLTLRQVQELIVSRLADYLKSPQVLVSVQGFNSQRVLVSGAVLRSGYLPITNLPMTLLDALTLSGAVAPENRLAPYPMLINEAAQQSIRSGADHQKIPDLSRVQIRRGSALAYVDVDKMLRTGDMQQNWLLRNGDIVYVPAVAKNYVYLLGQVKQQSLVEITENKTSLAQVLAIDGGVDQSSANTRQIYVIRGGIKQPTIYQLDGEASDSLLLADAFVLEPRDILYVSEAKVSRWNRVLNQIIPSFQTTVTGTAISNAVR